MSSLIIIGGGEHARVVIDTARTRPELWSVAGFVDPQPCDETRTSLGVDRLGDDRSALDRLAEHAVVIGVGSLGVDPVRARIALRYAGARWATIIHAGAYVSPAAHIGEGVVILANAVIQPGARIGAHAVIGTGAIVEHDVRIGAFASLGPGAVVGGATTIGDGAYLGLGSRVRDHVTIGANAMIAMGAVVVGDVPDGATMLGLPARRR